VRFAYARAEAALAGGAPDEAIELLGEVLHQPAERERPKYVILGRVLRARAFSSRGERERALEDARLAVATARRFGDPLLLVRALAAHLAIEYDDSLYREANSAIETIARSIPDEALRACFETSETVRSVALARR
jgi:hypothetical protein